MSQIFDFSGIQNNEKTMRKTWSEFRQALENGDFTFDDLDQAKKSTFLRVYDDLFNQNSGIEHKTISVKDLKGNAIGRGTILGNTEVPNHERFVPKKEFIKDNNRFSPPGVEWLYLAIGTEDDIHQCAQAECRVKLGQRFGFCHFKFDELYDDLKLVDLTIADRVSYYDLNQRLENYGQKQVKKGIKATRMLGFIPSVNVDKDEFKKVFTQWGVIHIQNYFRNRFLSH